MVDVSFFDPAKEAEVKRRRAYAQAVAQQSQQPQNTEVVGGYAVQQSPLASLAKALGQGFAGYENNQADNLEAGIGKQRQELLANAVGQLGTDPKAAAQMLLQDPQSQDIGLKLYGNAMDRESDMAKYDRDRANDLEKYNRERADKVSDFDKDAKLKKEIANIRANSAQGGGYTVDPETGATVPVYSNKPLPIGALKLQNEAIDSLGASQNISDNAQQIIGQLDSGQLDLGPIANLLSKGKNMIGMSDQNSQNFSNMQTTLEKIRNDTLRLNKGVQTEGDAERALNEVINSTSDPKVFKNAMEKLNSINERGAELQKLQVNNVRSNYNASPYDFDKVGALPKAVAPASKYKKGQTATLPNGSKVQFDGSGWVPK